jgi:hypothetical protein
MRSIKASPAGMSSHHNGCGEVHLWSKTDARFCHHPDLFVGRYILDILAPASEPRHTSTNENSTSSFTKYRIGANRGYGNV